MTRALAPAGVSQYYQRLAELSTLPFWQLPDFGQPSGPERGHVWHWQDIYPELARSRDIADDAAVLQRRADLVQSRARPAGGRCHRYARGGLPDAVPRRERPARAHSMSALRFGLAGSGARISHKCPFAGR
jgi:gentisate 1,2-dioxygenase